MHHNIETNATHSSDFGCGMESAAMNIGLNQYRLGLLAVACAMFVGLSNAQTEDPKSSSALKLSQGQSDEIRRQFKAQKEAQFNEEVRKREAMANRIILGDESPWRYYSFPLVASAHSTNRLGHDAGRTKLLRKLESIILPEWKIPHETELSEVLKKLHHAARANDPEKTGVNLITAPTSDEEIAARALVLAPDPSGHEERATEPVENFLVTIDPPLKNVRLVDAIRAVANTARPNRDSVGSHRIEYIVEEYAVVFKRGTAEKRPKESQSSPP